MTNFSAQPAKLGYLYQARSALLFLIREGKRNPSADIIVEGLDDVVFEKNGIPIELIQTKHHVSSTASLSDASVELWKTIRIWSSELQEKKIDLNQTHLTLITTARAATDSAASKLRLDDGRDIENALSLLCAVAKNSENVTNADAYKAFDALGPEIQRNLVSSIYIFDQAPGITDLMQAIQEDLRYVTRPKYLPAVCERLEGWWFNVLIEHLKTLSHQKISHKMLQDKINDIQEQFTQDSLPIDFLTTPAPEEGELEQDQRMFIEQLRLIAITQPRINQAISDYYKAFQQRSKWVREDLLIDGELEIYETKLIDEWKRLFHAMKEDLGSELEEDLLQREGRALYNAIEQRQHVNIRENCTEPYIMRGSYHILSNQLRVGWHSDFLNRLKQLIAKAQNEKL